MRRIFMMFVLFISSFLVADEFEVFVEINSFLDGSRNTINDIVFKVPHENLGYVNDNGKRISVLKTKYRVLKGNKVLIEDTLTNNIIRTKKSKNNYFVDKLSLTIKSPDLEIEIYFEDDLSNKIFQWESKLEYIDSKAFLSSIEFNKKIEKANGRYDKFIRDGNLFLPNPHHNYFLPNEDSLYYYYEFYNLKQTEGFSKISVTSKISKNDTLIFQIFDEKKLNKEYGADYQSINIADFKAGLYKIEIQLVDMIGRKTSIVEDVFVIRERENDLISIFGNIDDDYALIKYFLSNSERNVWKKLSLEGKLNFIDHFWKVSDSNPATSENEFFDLITQRVEFANKEYGTINVKGWQSDMGRIIIRNGMPDDVIEDETNSTYSRYVAKDYEIWKYYNGMKVYLFIDKMNNNRFKLIYIKNDDLENSAMDWEKLMGEDFDDSLLEY